MADDEQIPGLTADEQRFLETRGESGLPETPAAPPEQAPPATVPPAPLEVPTEPAETPEPEEEEADDGAIDPSTGKHHPRKIAYRKFRALEEQFQSQQEELARMREVLARGDERMKIINEALTEPPPAAVEEEEDPRPDPQQDVFAYLDWKERQDRRAFEQISEHFENQVQERQQQSFAAQQQEEIAQTVGRYRAEAQQVVAANPRFADAYTHLVRVRNAQYQALGIRDPADRAQRIAQEEYAVVSSAYGENVSPFQRLYDLAVASGFDPNNPNAAPAAAPAAPAVGGQPRTGGGRPQPSVAEIIENVRSGQQAAMSLSRGGGVPGDRLTPEILGNMSQKDFDYMMEHLPAERIRELLGGG